MQRLAATDGLTKIANRRTFEATLEREVARATRSAEHLSLVMVDIDHFKALNDMHGHQAGDEVLRNVAAALAIECRDFDTPARYGGEEFAVVLPGCGPEEARGIAERLRQAVAGAPAVVPDHRQRGRRDLPEPRRRCGHARPRGRRRAVREQAGRPRPDDRQLGRAAGGAGRRAAAPCGVRAARPPRQRPGGHAGAPVGSPVEPGRSS